MFLRHLSTVTLGVLVSALLAACGQSPAPAAATPEASTAQSQVERGKYLVEVASCNDCHTPLTVGPNGPEPDMTRMLSGHPESVTLPTPPAMAPSDPWNFAGAATNTAFAGPWGVSFAANLTPDENTGLGIWTEEMWMNTFRQGKHMGTSRAILPPMPWPGVGKMTDDDLRAVFAYLRSIPAVSNHVPDPIPPAGAPATN
jgi:mono/diheme cytochrome c family protein